MVPSSDAAAPTPALITIDESLNTGQRDSGNGDISNSRSCPPLWARAQRLAAVKVQGTPRPPPPPPPAPPPRTLLRVKLRVSSADRLAASIAYALCSSASP